VTFVTGHDVGSIDWDSVGQAETLVIFMGLTTFGDIARELMARGRPSDTPAIAVRWGTRPDQETVAGTLATLPRLIEVHALKPPATIILGQVVRLHEKLDWYGRLPLFGKRIVVTRAKGQAETLSAKLHELGADVVELPTIEIRPASDYAPLDRALDSLACYDWLIFTSVNGVRFFLERLDRSGCDLRNMRARLCAIGPATRAALERVHLKVDLMGREYVAEGLVAALAPYDLAGKRVLLPRAAEAVVPGAAAAEPRETFGGTRRPDCITFTSSSTVKNFVAVAGVRSLEGVHAVSIGPITSGTARGAGIRVVAEAQPFTVDGLVNAIVQLLR